MYVERVQMLQQLCGDRTARLSFERFVNQRTSHRQRVQTENANTESNPWEIFARGFNTITRQVYCIIVLLKDHGMIYVLKSRI